MFNPSSLNKFESSSSVSAMCIEEDCIKRMNSRYSVLHCQTLKGTRKKDNNETFCNKRVPANLSYLSLKFCLPSSLEVWNFPLSEIIDFNLELIQFILETYVTLSLYRIGKHSNFIRFT